MSPITDEIPFGTGGIGGPLPAMGEAPPFPFLPEEPLTPEDQVMEMLGGFAPQQSEQPPPPPPLKPTDKMPKELQDEMAKYAMEFCNESRKVIKAKEPRYRLMDALDKGDIGIREWREARRTGDAPVIDKQKHDDSGDADDWESNFVYQPSFITNQFVVHSYTSIFSGPDWLVVYPEPSSGFDPNPSQVQDVQKWYIHKLEQGKIHARVWDSLRSLARHGPCYGMVSVHIDRTINFYEETIFDQNTGLPAVDPKTGKEKTKVVGIPEQGPPVPIIQVIPPDQALPDTRAHHNDIQRHRGFGFWQEKTTDEVLDGFRTGKYNLNLKEFKQKYKRDAVGYEDTGDTPLFEDRDAREGKEVQGKVRVWEWHGRAPTAKGFIEGVVTFVTDPKIDETSGGIPIRVLPEPLIKTKDGLGVRPFAMASYDQGPGFDSKGAIGAVEDTLFQLSQFIGQIQDAVRITVNPSWQKVNINPELDRQLEESGYRIKPGDFLNSGFEGKPGIIPTPTPNVPVGQAFSMVEFLKGSIEEQMALKDIVQGLQRHETPATTATIIQEQGQAPISAILDLWARNFLAPLCTISLHIMAVLAEGDQTVYIPKADQGFEPVTIPQSVLNEGNFKVVPTITKQDASRVSKAQVMQRLLDTLPNVDPMLRAEGKVPVYSEVVNRLVDLLGVDGADRLIRTMSQEEVAQQQMDQQIQQLIEQGMPPDMAQAQVQQQMSQSQGQQGGNGGTPPMDPVQMQAQMEAQPGEYDI